MKKTKEKTFKSKKRKKTENKKNQDNWWAVNTRERGL